MARGLLAGATQGLACLLASLPALALGPVAPCVGASGTQAPALLPDAEKSPLYAMLRAKFGAPTDCRAKTSGDTRAVVIGFGPGRSLTYSVTEIIETSSQEAVLPPTQTAISRSDAIRALRRVEQVSALPTGCGIHWSAISASRSPDAVAEGSACNCKAHLKTEKGAVTGLSFSMAC